MLNLTKVAEVKKNFESLEGDDKKLVQAKASAMRKFLEDQLPALTDDDRANVAWVISNLLGHIHQCPLGEAGDLVYSSLIAYGVATVDLLGWFDQQPPTE